MYFNRTTLFVSFVLTPCLALAEGASGGSCTQSRAQLEANKQLLRDFFAFQGTLESRAERFLREDYVQHNPRLLRLDRLTGATGSRAWLEGTKEAERRGIDIIELGGIQLGKPVILMAECDLVTAIYKGVRDDPDRPGETYEVFAFETFRVREGKFAEHWDQVTLRPGWLKSPPAPDAHSSTR